MNLAEPSRPKPGKVLSDASNGRRAKWVPATMSEFCGSSVEHPWELDSHGDLVLSAAAQAPTVQVSVPPKRKIIDRGPPSSIIQDPPRPESSLNAEFEARRRTPSTHIRAARDRITQTPRNGRPSLTSDQNHGPRRAAVAPTTSSAATRPVRRTAAEKARRSDDWLF
ncbi:hypothetical protein B0H14DRAFT_3505053 [Mycena olivaceomarginata]|nr:hypothetical protein B0H14DRAFT_3505053 [Mycena olivaceomarginata]